MDRRRIRRWIFSQKSSKNEDLRSFVATLFSTWIIKKYLTFYHSSRLIVVEIHQVSQFPSFLQTFLIRSINKSFGKIDSIPQVVAEKFYQKINFHFRIDGTYLGISGYFCISTSNKKYNKHTTWTACQEKKNIF